MGEEVCVSVWKLGALPGEQRPPDHRHSVPDGQDPDHTLPFPYITWDSLSTLEEETVPCLHDSRS